MKSILIHLKKSCFGKAVISLIILLVLFGNTASMALESTDLSSSTGLGTTSWGNDTVLNTANGAVLNWNNFNTSSGQSVMFNQPGINASVLNRISGPATQFDGSLLSNGRVFLVNPAGVYFGAGSSVNVNQLIASTLDILNFDVTNPDFLAGKYQFGNTQETTGGIINNSSSMYAGEGVALIGRFVTNNGTITTGQGGFVVMAAGDRVFFGEPSGNIIIEMDSASKLQPEDGKIINNGDITSPSGKITLAAGDIYSQILDIPKVRSGNGTIEQNGTISTNGTTGTGGTIDLTAADEVALGSSSSTSANAGNDADAGYILIHSKDAAIIDKGAKIEARGGSSPDSDGTVKTSIEISGDQVTMAGDIDASAANNKRGKVVIDAFDLTVKDGYTPDDPGANNIYEKWIESQSHTAADVELVAHSSLNGNINVENISDGQITGGSGNIILHTKYDTGGINFESESSGVRTTKGGNIYMSAGAGGINVGDITTDTSSGGTEPGKIMLTTNNDGDISTGNLKVSGGGNAKITVIASGDLTINGNVEALTNQSCQVKNHSIAQAYLESTNDNIILDGHVLTSAYGIYSSLSEITMNAGKNIIVDTGSNLIEALARTTNYNYPAVASVSIHAGDQFARDIGGQPTVHVYAKTGVFCDTAEVYSTDPEEQWDETHGDAHAILEIEDHTSWENPIVPEPPIEPPVPPVLPAGQDDEYTTHMGIPIEGNVLGNDDPGVTVTSSHSPLTAQ